MPIPHFQFNLSSRHRAHFGFITDGDEVICRINNDLEFYNALGYTNEAKSAGFTPDEFLWFEYRRDGCNKTDLCLQAKLIEYMHKHSAIFNDNYAEQYKKWIGICSDDKSRESLNCTHCIMHPEHKMLPLPNECSFVPTSEYPSLCISTNIQVFGHI